MIGVVISTVLSFQQPKVGVAFQEEIARLGREGLILKESLETSLTPNTQHLAAIFERAKKTEGSASGYEFRIFEADRGACRTLFRRPEFYFSFADLDQMTRLNGTDINGDGLKEVLVQSSSGGNCWSCNPTEIYQLRNHKIELIAVGPITNISDLNGDGVMELVVTDARWEGYDEFSHVAAPAARMVYAWRGGRYVYASPEFTSFYRGELDQLRASIEEARGRITADSLSDEDYLGKAVSLTITYAHSGDPVKALKELETLLTSNSKSAEQTKHRLTILDDFRRGDSSKRLREFKTGDPLPLS